MRETITLKNLMLILFLLMGIGTATSQIVTSSTDDGTSGTLRNQIASAQDGGVIIFLPTVTNITLVGGQITIDKSLTITGNGIATSIINGNGASRIFNITDGTVILNAMTLTNGTDSNGGAISVIGSDLFLSAVTFTNNTANSASGSGGAIIVGTDATLTAVGTTFTNNIANRAGGAIEVLAGTETLLTNCTFTMNNAGIAPSIAAPGNGGALHVSGSAAVTIIGGDVSNNKAAAEGGGLWNGAGTMTIDGTTILMNKASGVAADNGGGGIYNLNGGTLIIDNAMVMDNMADGTAGSGGGILNDIGAMATITNTTISGNSSNRAGGGIENNAGTITLNTVLLNTNSTMMSPGNGGGLHVTGMGIVNLTNGTVTGNTAGSEGGGLWNGAGTMTINGTTISGNTASGIAADNGGGGIYNFNGGTLMIMNAQIMNNIADGTAGSGGGILNDVGSMLTVIDSDIVGNMAKRAGGGIEDNSGTSTIILTNLTMESNTAMSAPGNGGGLHITGAGSATITGGSVSMNTAANEGGGLWNGAGTMTLNNVMISENTAMGIAAANGGGGIFNNGGTLTADNITLADNTASGTAGSGGGLLSKVGAVTITNSAMTGNSANRAGGGIEIIDGSLTVSNSTLNDNNVDGDAGTPAPGNGGGLHVSGISTITFTNNDVSNNLARREGGGLWNQTSSTMNVSGCTIDSNIARGSDPTQGGAGIFNNGGNLSLSMSSVTNNQLTGALGNGAGIHVKSGSATVMTSTISGNVALMIGGGIYNNAGLMVNASTIANNIANMGGGLANNVATLATIKNSIIANNSAIIANSEDISSTNGTVVSQGYNLIESGNAAALAAMSSDIVGQDPMLGPLALNGNTNSASMTHALITGSPAYNTGDPANAVNDQRDFAIFGGTRDIGSFEAQQQLATQQFAFANGKATVIYPNPTSGTINIQIADGFGDNVRGTVIDMGTGKTVMSFEAQSSLNTINLVPMATGLYIVRIASDAGVENHKLMVKN